MRIIQERTAFKILLDRNGSLVSFTSKRRAFFLFLSPKYVGLRVAPTTDPDLGIVEVCGYDIPKILKNWNRLSRIKLKRNTQSGN